MAATCPVELKGKGDETLWSFLVTPHPHVTGDIHKDLAGHVVKKLLEAIKSRASLASTFAAISPLFSDAAQVKQMLANDIAF